MNPKDLKLLQSILELGRRLELESQDAEFSEKNLQHYLALLHETQFSSGEEVSRLAAIADHLHPKMTLKHFVNFLVPIERLLNRHPSDDELSISTEDLSLSEAADRPRREIYFILENFRSAFNVGSILRLADGFASQKVYLCGYTPTSEQKQVQKTSLSSWQVVPQQSFDKTADAITELKTRGVRIVALETCPESRELHATPLLGPIAFLLGNERFGLEKNILALADEVRHIPMHGLKNSLNVTHAAAIAAWEWGRQNP